MQKFSYCTKGPVVSQPLPPDPGRLAEVRPVDDSELRGAQAAEEAARKAYFSAEAGSFEQHQADAQWFSTRTAADNQMFVHRQAVDTAAYTEAKNAAILAVDRDRDGRSDYMENREAEQKRLLQMGMGFAGAMMAVGGAHATLGAIADGPEAVATPAAPTALSSLMGMFQTTIAPRESGVTAFSEGPADRFNALGVNPVTAFGLPSTLEPMQAQLGGQAPNTPAVGAADVIAEVAPSVAAPAVPIIPKVARNAAMLLENSLASGPKFNMQSYAKANNWGNSTESG
jgi:hypothetical protein